MVAPGLRGHVEVIDGVTWAWVLHAEEPGSGCCAAWLDRLDGPVVVPTVVSPRLATMLARRGFTEIDVDNPRPEGSPVLQAWVRP